MTAQFDDTFRYRGREYAVAGISEGELFDPAVLNLHPIASCTACYRGYQAVFGLAGNRLVLDSLHVNLPPTAQDDDHASAPEINGVKPAGPKKEYDLFNNHYEGLAYHLEYSGGVLLADGFIQELYVHMGFHPAWKYRDVVELVFESGVLKREFDRSDQMAQIRGRFAEYEREQDTARSPTRDQIAAWIERAFDRKYEL